ncbi:MAG TPA: aminotransferase class I/II-fold pyridoxal phosphate-dependent enzyme [Acidimicrobiales bacterium]|nr:aminotransferase class I/II-fold pyridoxal phosphate-dependent enzyme [Acidimicrobiales bacterium]
MPEIGECSPDVLRRRTSEKWAAHPPDVVPAFIAEMDFDVAEPIRRAAAAVIERSDLGYPHPAALGDAFASFARAWWEWEVEPGRVHAVADVMTGVAVVLGACTPPGSGVVINPPVYPPFFFRVEHAERRLVPVPLREDTPGRHLLDLEALEAALADPSVAAYLLCSPHNPLGRVWSRRELLDVAEVCARHDVLVLVDEIHAPLVMEGAEFVPFLSLDHPATKRAVVFQSASKGWNIPGLKCGLAVAGSAELSAVINGRWEALFPSQPGVAGTVAAYTHPEAHAWLRAVVGQLAENRRLLASLLPEAVPGIRAVRPEASYLVWLDFGGVGGTGGAGLGDDPAAVLLERGRVALTSGLGFGEPGRGHARLNMGTSPELLEEIVRRVALGAAAGSQGRPRPLQGSG